MHLIVSCSLNKNSKSRAMALYASTLFKKESRVLDLSTLNIPFCDGDDCYSSPVVKDLRELIVSAESIIIAAPVYNYDLNAVAKNLVELTGREWTDKVVGFICAAGGKGSYMSPMSFANSLMLDFRCIIIPRFVYATGESFSDAGNIDQNLKDRISELVEMTTRISEAL